MPKIAIILAFLFLCYCAQAADPKSLSSLYVQNKGQILDEKGNPVPDVLAYLQGEKMQVFITTKGYTLISRQTKNGKTDLHKIEIILEGASIVKDQVIFAGGVSPELNFYSERGEIEKVKTTSTIIVRNIYPGIDWLWNLDTYNNPKHEFMVNLGADASKIRYSISGALASIKGNSIKYTHKSFVVQEGPVVYQFGDKSINADMQTDGKSLVFRIPEDMQKSGGFTIDPALELIWGASASTGIQTTFRSIDLNYQLESVTVGSSNDFLPVFPQVSGSFQQIDPIAKDIVIMKSDSDQNLIWATFLGGVDDDEANSVSCSSSGIFITGYSASWNFPRKVSGDYNNPVQLNGQDAFIAKFDNEGKWKWSTGYGGSRNDEGYAVKCFNNKVYICGYTHSADFPLLSRTGSYYYSGSPDTGRSDAFIVEFDTAGNHQWATCFGGSGKDYLTSLFVNSSGLYVTGYTDGNIPLVNSGAAYYQTSRVNTDAFITRFSPFGALNWSTYYGGNGRDVASSILHNNCGLFICGTTDSSGLPVLSQNNGNFYQPSFSGKTDGFMLKLDGSSLEHNYSSYYGTPGVDVFTKMDMDANCNLVITGYTDSGSVFLAGSPTHFIQPGSEGGYDAILFSLDASQSMSWNTLFGTMADDYGYDVKFSSYSKGSIDMIGRGLYNYGLNRIGGTYVTAPCTDFETCARVSCNGVSNRFLRYDSLITGPMDTGIVDTGSGGGPGGNYWPCTRYLNFHALIPDKNTCPNSCNGKSHIDTANILGCPPYTFLWSTGNGGLSDTGLCEQYWSRVIDKRMAKRTIYDRYKILKKPIRYEVPQTNCGIMPDWNSIVLPVGGGAPYTINYRGENGGNCPSHVYFDIIDTADCVISYEATWKKINEGITPVLWIDAENCKLVANMSLPLERECFVFGSWYYIIIHGTDTSRVPVARKNYDDYSTEIPITLTSGSYTCYIDKKDCITPGYSIYIPNDIKDHIIVTQACSGGNSGNMDITVYPDTATLNELGSYTVFVTLKGDSAGYVASQSYFINGSFTHQFNFDSLPSDNYMVGIFTDLDTCGHTKEYINLKPVDFIFNSPSVYCGTMDTLNVTMKGGLAPYSYEWQHTQLNSKDVVLTEPGTYSITVVDAQGCQLSKSIAVSGSPALLVNSVSENLAPCAPNLFTSASASFTGGTFPFNYIWSSGEINPIAEFLPQGQNYVIVFDANNCRDTFEFHNTKHLPVSVKDTILLNSACSSTASALVYPSFGYPPYNILWSNGSTAFNPTSLPTGSNTYTVTDSFGCTTSDNVTIYKPDSIRYSVALVKATCATNTGSAQISISSGVAPVKILWADGDTTYNRSNMVTGNYSFTITDGNGCTKSRVILIGEDNPVTVQLQTECDNDEDGYTIVYANVYDNNSGNIDPSGLAFSWSVGANQENINVPEGNYSLTVTDNRGCTATNSIHVLIPKIILIKDDYTICYGGDVTVDFEVSYGGGGLSGSYYAQQTVPFGQNYFTFYDYQRCPLSGVLNRSWPTAPIVAEALVEDETCNKAGSILLTVTGGSESYNIYGDNSFPSGYYGPPPVSDTIFNLSSGYYNIDIYDMNNCLSSYSFYITPKQEITVSHVTQPISCYGNHDGKVTIMVADGHPPYTINGNVFIDSIVIDTLSAGLHSILVKDIAGCSKNITFSLVSPPQLIALVDTGNGISCNSNQAQVIINASGGTAPYIGLANYSLVPGSYQYTVSDARGCSADAIFTLSPVQLMLNELSLVQPDCHISTGTIHVATSGTSAPYSLIVNQVTYGPYTDTISISDLPPGVYAVTAMDAFGCFEVMNAQIDIYIPPLVSFGTKDISCYGLKDGEVWIAAFQGSAPFNINGNFFNSFYDESMLAAGSYTYIVSDASNCGSDTVNFSIGQPTPLTSTYIVTNSIVCSGDSLHLDINAQGGTAPYSGVGSFTFFNGTYTPMVTDANYCTVSVNVPITATQPAAFYVDTSTVNPACLNANGQFKFRGTGGQAPYVLSDSSINIPFVDSGSVGLPMGNYTFKVSDALGCSRVFSFSIGSAIELSGKVKIGNVKCYGDSSGTALVTIAGGSGNYSLNNIHFSDTAVVGNLASGMQQFNVVDNLGCVLTLSGYVSQPNPLVIDNQILNHGITCYDRVDALATINASGGTLPYNYGLARDSGALVPSTNPTYSGLNTGNYSVIVSDANNCTSVAGFTIATFERSRDSISIDSVSCYGAQTGVIRVYPTPADRNPYSFSLNGDTPQVHNVYYSLAAGDYSVVIADKNDCRDTVYVVVNQPDSIDGRVWLNEVLLPIDSTLIDQREQAIFTKLSANPWDISFSPGAASAIQGDTLISIRPRVSTTYTVRVYKDSVDRSCFREFTGYISVHSIPILPNLLTIDNDGFNDKWEIDMEVFDNSKLIIFDRTGEIVYETAYYNNDWDGTYQNTGQKVADGAYFYILTKNDNPDSVFKGAINILNSTR